MLQMPKLLEAFLTDLQSQEEVDEILLWLKESLDPINEMRKVIEGQCNEQPT